MIAATHVARVRAQAQPEHAGSGIDALAGVHEVPLATTGNAGIHTRLGANYGWTESVLNADDAHHRIQVDAAGSAALTAWLSAALRVLGRYDAHSGAVSDSGTVTETHATARATFRLSPDFSAGGELGLWLPAGDTVGSAVGAVSGDALLLFAYAPDTSPLTVGLALGLRIDRSKHAGGDPSRYSAADRLALGASDAVFAARQGVALSYRTGPWEWVAEWAYRMYFEQIAESPMWIHAGARYRPIAPLQLELLIGVSPSQRPALDDDAPLAVVEPRLSAGLSATYAWAQPSAAKTIASTKPSAPAAQKPLASVRGQVSTPSGTALADAAVTLRRGESEQVTTSDTQGSFAFTALPSGAYELGVSAPGFITDQSAIELHDGDAPELRIALKRELPQGQIRGTVRRFDGRPIVATIAIASLGLSDRTKDDGTFEIDVPPGEYTVAVSARGFRNQSRKARIELNGVAILVVELEAAR